MEEAFLTIKSIEKDGLATISFDSNIENPIDALELLMIMERLIIDGMGISYSTVCKLRKVVKKEYDERIMKKRGENE